MPSFWERLRSRFGGEAKAADSLEVLRDIYGSWASSWAGKDVTLRTAFQVSVALACGRVISEGLAMLPWKVLRQQGKQILPAYSHWAYDKLAVDPNPLQTAFEFKETMGLHLAFCGNAYIWTPTVAGRVDAFYLLEPKWITVKYRWPELPTYDVRADDGRTFTLSSAEVWQVRGPSWCTYKGFEFVHLARQALGLSMALEEGQAKIQSLGVRMPGFLSIESKLTDEQHKKLTQWIEKFHAGAENAGRPMILDNAAKWVAQSMNNVEAQALEQRKFEVEEVCRFMRVMPIMVGYSDKTATYASAEQMFLAHAVHTIGPWAVRIEQSADKHVLTKDERAQGYYTKLNEKALLRMSAEAQMNMLARAVLTGIYTQNEARELLDRNPIDGHDELLTPTNMVAGDPPAAGLPGSNPRPDDDTE